MVEFEEEYTELPIEIIKDNRRWIRNDLLAKTNADMLLQKIQEDDGQHYNPSEVRQHIQDATSRFLALWSLLNGGETENSPQIMRQINGICSALVAAYKLTEGKQPTLKFKDEQYTEVK
jgi:hypothetical protein